MHVCTNGCCVQGKEVAIKSLPKVRGKLTLEKTLEKLAREVDVMERLQVSQEVGRNVHQLAITALLPAVTSTRASAYEAQSCSC